MMNIQERKIKVIKPDLVIKPEISKLLLDEIVLEQLRRQLLRSLDEVNKSLGICGCENCGRKATGLIVR